MTTGTIKQTQQEVPVTFDHIQVTIIIETLPALSEHPEFQRGLAAGQEYFLEDHEAAPLTESEMMDEVEANLSRSVFEHTRIFSHVFQCKPPSYIYNLGFVFGTINEGLTYAYQVC